MWHRNSKEMSSSLPPGFASDELHTGTDREAAGHRSLTSFYCALHQQTQAAPHLSDENPMLITIWPTRSYNPIAQTMRLLRDRNQIYH